MPINDEIFAALEKLPPPPAWRMEPSLYNLFELLKSQPKIAIKIILITLEYDRECAAAKIKMYDAIKEFISNVKLE